MQTNSKSQKGLLIALIALLIVGSFLPNRAKHAIGTQGHWHRPLHITLFAATAIAAGAAFPRRTIPVAFLLLLLAGSLELAEALPNLHRFEWPDVRDDAIGILAGLSAFSARNRSRPFHAATNPLNPPSLNPSPILRLDMRSEIPTLRKLLHNAKLSKRTQEVAENKRTPQI